MSNLESNRSNIVEGLPFKEIIGAGVNTADIKELIVSTLTPYFDNVEILDKYALGILAPEAENFRVLKSDEEHFKLFIYILELYKEAKNIDSELCFDICAKMEPDTMGALNQYWSKSQVEIPKSNLDLHEFSAESFSQVGMLIEACIQPFLQEILMIKKIIACGRGATFEKVSLAKLLKELSEDRLLESSLVIKPYDIPLNQIRNISQHYNFLVVGGIVQAKYSQGKHELTITRLELEEIVGKVLSLFNTVRLARVIFNVDNALQITPKLKNEVEPREMQRLFSVASGLMNRGFKCNSIIPSVEYINIEFVDLREHSRLRVLELIYHLSVLYNEYGTSSFKLTYSSNCGGYSVNSIIKIDDINKLVNNNVSKEEYFGLLNLQETIVSRGWKIKVREVFMRVFVFLKLR